MGDKTKIEWTDASWNPVSGCTKVSAGCKHCYAETIAERFGAPAYPNGFGITFRPHKLEDPLRWKKPRRIFVNSMSDLFHEEIPDSFRDEVFGVMAGCYLFENRSDHIFQVLTKRPEKMRRYLTAAPPHELLIRWCEALRGLGWHCKNGDILLKDKYCYDKSDHGDFPLPNVWLGVSVENRKTIGRITELHATPAAVRFVSLEPLLEPVSEHLGDLRAIDWAIIGGESGPGARPFPLHDCQPLIKRCREAGVAVFVKQMGSDWAKRVSASDRKGGDISEFPEGLRVRDFPEVSDG